MSNQVKLNDNNGNIVGVGVTSVDPFSNSTLRASTKLSGGTADTAESMTVVGGGIYAVTAYKTGGFYFGIAICTTAANVRWVCPLYQTVVFKIPEGTTTLHFCPDTTSALGFIRRIA
jgi:hypothetical protein